MCNSQPAFKTDDGVIPDGVDVIHTELSMEQTASFCHSRWREECVTVTSLKLAECLNYKKHKE